MVSSASAAVYYAALRVAARAFAAPVAYLAGRACKSNGLWSNNLVLYDARQQRILASQTQRELLRRLRSRKHRRVAASLS